VDLVDADDVVRGIHERSEVVEALEERAGAAFAVAALVTIVIVAFARERTEDCSTLSAVFLAAVEVADERIALSGRHRAGVQRRSTEGTKGTKFHAVPPGRPTSFYPTNSREYPPSVDKSIFAHSVFRS
jgi:hypothetical protein